ncbi:MAG TPA: LysM peptidoglycan-binding domain-containing protein [Burkholderiaceae bacterium]
MKLLPICLALAFGCASAQTSTYPVTDAQRQTAQAVAQAGVPLSELAANAPDSYTVKKGDTLWDISKLFLTSPWRWPELWGMNKEQIANPHLIYPGQVLVLVKADGRAQLKLADATSSAATGSAGTTRLSPQIRASAQDDNPINAIPLHLIEPFLNEAVVFDTDELAAAPRIVAAPEGRVLMTRGDIAYAMGDFSRANDWRVFRTAKPLRDPLTGEVLGYEAPYLGTADVLRSGRNAVKDSPAMPTTLSLGSVRQEVGTGDRLAPVPQRDLPRYVPHAPTQALDGRVVSIYGEALSAGQNQIVALNRGQRDGVERGHVLALWQAGRKITDRTGGKAQELQLPDERQGTLFVFQVFNRVSYALILSTGDAIKPGDRFSKP